MIITTMTAKKRRPEADDPPVPSVRSLMMAGVRVNAMSRRRDATTRGVKRRRIWPKSPKRPVRKRRAPPMMTEP